MQLTTSTTLDVPDDVLNELACDLITAACEGGINYWAACETYRWGDPTIGHSHERANGSRDWQPGDTRYATVTIHSDVDPGSEPDFEPVYVDAAKMIDAIRKLLSGEVKEFYTQGYTKTLRTRIIEAFSEVTRGVPFDDTDFDSDADDADSMMQIACLGTVVYG